MGMAHDGRRTQEKIQVLIKHFNREIEITSYSVGRHWDEVCIEKANFTDGDMRDLDDDELDEIQKEFECDLLQNAKEFAAG